MATIRPFRGIYYNPDKVADLRLVATPPYDVITPEERRRYRERHPNNIIHIILPEGGRGIDKYEEAATCFQRWQQDGILVREKKPSVYPYQQYFRSQSGEKKRRDGFIALVKLESLHGSVIIPHEETTPKPVEDRLRLFEACGANLSHVFVLYSDPGGAVACLFDDVWAAPPRYEFRDDDGVVHRLWCVDCADIIVALGKKMIDKTLIIADGHHRYATALVYREKMRGMYPDASRRSPFEYTMMYLTPMEDEGVVILPTHRLVPDSDAVDPGDFCASMLKYFVVKNFEFEVLGGEERARETFFSALDEATHVRTIGLYIREQGRYFLLTLKKEVRLDELLRRYPGAIRELDVTLLDGFVLTDLLGLAEDDVGLTKDRSDAVEQVRSGRFRMAFFLRPPTVTQVRKVAEAGEVMPRKSTYFYPKVASGLVINKIDPSEEVALT